MEQEDRLRLEQIETLLIENNKMIKSIRNGTRYTLYARIAYWVIILALVYGVYAYSGPALTNLLGSYSDSIKNAPGLKADIQFLDQAKKFTQ